MKNRAIKSVIAAATSLALLGSGVAVAQDSNKSTQTQSANSSSSNSKGGLKAGEGQLPHFEINGKEATGLIAIIAALNVAIEVVGKILETALTLVEGFQKLAPKPAEAAK